MLTAETLRAGATTGGASTVRVFGAGFAPFALGDSA
jgi:hypothetical protein